MTSFRHALPLAILLGVAPLWVIAEESPPLEADVHLERFEDWTRTRVTVPGRLVSYALPRSADGSREIALLVAPRDNPDRSVETDSDDENDDAAERLPACSTDEDSDLTLLRLKRDSSQPQVRLREGLPHDLEALDAVDLEGDGVDELLLARKQELLLVGPKGERRVVSDPGLVWSSLHPRATEQPQLDGRPLVPTTPLGQLFLFGAGEAEDDEDQDQDEAWNRLASVDIPLKGRANRQGLTVFNARPWFVGIREDGTLLFTTTPEPYGNQRLQILLIEISVSGASQVTDCWVRLPGPEDLLEQEFLIIDEQVMLLVTTKPANKLSLFGEKRIRLFPLERDRSRLGKPPVYVTESRMNIWQQAEIMLLDVNADGRRDLVLGYWKGLKDDRVVLDVYLREADGWFADSPVTTSFDVDPAKRRDTPESKPSRPDPDRSFVSYGRDLDGDSLPDLLLRTAVTLLVFPGRISKDGTELVEKKPRELSLFAASQTGEYFVSVGPGHFDSWSEGEAGRPRLADLDADGDAEILIVTPGANAGNDLLQIVDLGR